MRRHRPDVGVTNEWKQTSDPVTTSEAVQGYLAVDINSTAQYWGGLAKSSAGQTFIDGSVGHGNWFYAIGSNAAHGGGIPGPNTQVVTKVELYACGSALPPPPPPPPGGGGSSCPPQPPGQMAVTTVADNLDATDCDCTLREAVMNANSNNDTTNGGCAAGAGADTIILPAGTYTLTLQGPDEDANATGDIDVTDPQGLLIQGAGAETTIVQAGTESPITGCADCVDRVFDATGGLGLHTLTVRHGQPPASQGGGGLRFRAANIAGLNATFTHNLVSDDGDGGAIDGIEGVFACSGCIIDNNRAVGPGSPTGGGGLRLSDVSGTLTDSTVTNNQAHDVGGGLVVAVQTFHVVNTTVQNNAQVGPSGRSEAGGGGIFASSNGRVFLTGSTVTDNTDDRAGSVGDDCLPNPNPAYVGFFQSNGGNTVGADTGCPSDGPGDQTVGAGYSLYFDGVDDRIDIPDNQDYAADEQSFTIECWVKLTQPGTSNRLLVGNYGGPGHQEAFFGLWAEGNNTVSFMLRSPNSARTKTAVRIDGVLDGTWHHLAGVRDTQEGKVKLYLDGNLAASVDSDPGDNRYQSMGDLRYQGALTIGTSYGRYTQGHIDDVRVWSVARSEQEIQQNMDQKLSPQPGLVGYWPFDEGSGTTAEDASGNENPGTLTGGVTWDADIPGAGN